MRVFFTQKNTEVQEKEEVNALDIVTEKFVVSIRINGFEIKSRTENTTQNGKIDLDLGG